MNVKALIFDMDGLLLETEVIAIQTFEEACTVFGVEMKRDLYYRCIGTNETRAREILLKGYGKIFLVKAFSSYGMNYTWTGQLSNRFP
jgi:beta-phosphoglucomutase-like phosphatase (HAD superfamily)